MAMACSPSWTAAISVFAVGPMLEPGMAAAIDARVGELKARLAPWITPQALLNPARHGIDPAQAFDDASWKRLVRAQDTYDPERVILSVHRAA